MVQSIGSPVQPSPSPLATEKPGPGTTPAAPSIKLGHAPTNSQGVAPLDKGLSPGPLPDNGKRVPTHKLQGEETGSIAKTPKEKAQEDLDKAKKKVSDMETSAEKATEKSKGKKFHQLTQDDLDDHYRKLDNDSSYKAAKKTYNDLKAAFDQKYD